MRFSPHAVAVAPASRSAEHTAQLAKDVQSSDATYSEEQERLVAALDAEHNRSYKETVTRGSDPAGPSLGRFTREEGGGEEVTGGVEVEGLIFLDEEVIGWQHTRYIYEGFPQILRP